MSYNQILILIDRGWCVGMIVDLNKTDIGMQIVCMAIGSQIELIDKMGDIEG